MADTFVDGECSLFVEISLPETKQHVHSLQLANCKLQRDVLANCKCQTPGAICTLQV